MDLLLAHHASIICDEFPVFKTFGIQNHYQYQVLHKKPTKQTTYKIGSKKQRAMFQRQKHQILPSLIGHHHTLEVGKTLSSTVTSLKLLDVYALIAPYFMLVLWSKYCRWGLRIVNNNIFFISFRRGICI